MSWMTALVVISVVTTSSQTNVIFGLSGNLSSFGFYTVENTTYLGTLSQVA